MTRFLQLHLLSFFPPANLNRDDMGRPKTAVVGGATRLRLSSQALKRAYRTSEVFSRELRGHIGHRTKLLGREIIEYLSGKCSDARAVEIAQSICGAIGKVDAEKSVNTPQISTLTFLSPTELDRIRNAADRLVAGEKFKVTPATFFERTMTAADIALFGRMLTDEGLDAAKGKKQKAVEEKSSDEGLERAKRASYSVQAAAQVAHAITTHRVAIEDDYFTAVDDLRRSDDPEASGAGHVDEAAFGSGVFYLYICVDTALLTKNLGGDATLAGTALAALTEAAATAAPRGKQNSFAAHGRAHFILAERGDRQPRTLAGAFAKPVEGDDLVGRSIEALGAFRAALDGVYGKGCTSDMVLDAHAAFRRAMGDDARPSVHGSEARDLKELVAFCRG